MTTIKRTLSDSPQYFGGYLNMARMNAANITDSLSTKKDKASTDGVLNDAEICKTNTADVGVDSAMFFAKTKRYMPFLKIFDSEMRPKQMPQSVDALNRPSKDYADIAKKVKSLFSELNAFEIATATTGVWLIVANEKFQSIMK